VEGRAALNRLLLAEKERERERTLSEGGRGAFARFTSEATADLHRATRRIGTRACPARRDAFAGKSVDRGEGKSETGTTGQAGTWGLACDYFVNNACQPRAHAATLYTKMPDTLLGTELVSIWLHRRERERERKRERSECEGSRRGRERVCTYAWAHACYPLLRAVMHRWRCVCARAYRSPRPTHKSDVSADGICRYGRCLSFCFCSSFPLSLSLSLFLCWQRNVGKRKVSRLPRGRA